MRFFILLVVLYYFFCQTNAQQPFQSKTTVEELIFEMLPQQEDGVSYEEMYETLIQLYHNPINLNEATREDLEKLYVLSNQQILNFLEHRSKVHSYKTIYELKSIPEFDLQTITHLLFFAKITPVVKSPQKTWWEHLSSAKNNYILWRYKRGLEKRKGYTHQTTDSQKYLGDPNDLYLRWRMYTPQTFSIGITLDKDAGEELKWDASSHRYGIDFISGHIAVQNQGKWKSIIAGDYQLQIGQGVLFSSGFHLGKGSETIKSTRRRHLGLRPYTSATEYNFLRGIGATYNIKNIDITAFFSLNRRDGTVGTSDSIDATETFLETQVSTGLHRTTKEIEKKGEVLEKTVGTNITFTNTNDNLQVGLTFVHTDYSLVFQPNYTNSKDSLRNLFSFKGRRNKNIGIHGLYYWRNFIFFGEIAQSHSGGIGGVGGCIAQLTPQVEIAYLYRNYAKNFHSFYGKSFGENTRNINENGTYLGIKILPFKRVSLNGYYDRFHFPWMKYRVDAPSKGYEFLGRIEYRLNWDTKLFFQYRKEVKDRNLSNEEVIQKIGTGVRNNYAMQLDYKPKGKIYTKTRIQWSRFYLGGKQTIGMAFSQDIGVLLGKFKLDTRFALFDTDDYENRQYMYEKDVLWSFSVPPYHGRGIRSYLLLNYKYNRHWSFWVRYARFIYPQQQSIGSGGEEIQGNQKSEIKFQMKYRF